MQLTASAPFRKGKKRHPFSQAASLFVQRSGWRQTVKKPGETSKYGFESFLEQGGAEGPDVRYTDNMNYGS